MPSSAHCRRIPALAMLAALAACAGHGAAPSEGAGSGLLPAGAVRATLPGFGKIKHIVWLMQENRSFDDMFQGYPGADTQNWGYGHNGQKIPLKPVSLTANYDLDHLLETFLTDYDSGKMDGFDLTGTIGPPAGKDPAYGYVPHSESKLYFDMAKQYVLADHTFTSHIDGSYVSHQYFIAGQADGTVDLPSGDWGCDGNQYDTVKTITQQRTFGPTQSPCLNSETLADELVGAGLTWHFYASSTTDYWSAYHAISHIYSGTEFENVIAPSAQFLTDVQDGKLSTVTWITPTLEDSDHPGNLSKTGPEWIASVVNAIGTSRFWDSTAIFIQWDEWGGWYDHVAPPYEDYDGLGMRVGLLVISPYAKQNYVSHVQYEHGSMLRFVEDRFGLGQLAASDARANDPAVDCFDFTQRPRAFVPFPTKMRARDFLMRPLDTRPLDTE